MPHLREFFFLKMPLREEKVLENIKSGSVFSYVQCYTEIPENFQETFAKFPPIFINIDVGRDTIGPFMKEHADKAGLLPQRRRKLISSYFLENGTTIGPLMLFYLVLVAGLQKFLSLCAIHSDGVFQQLYSVCSEN